MKYLLSTFIICFCSAEVLSQCAVLEYCSNTDYNYGANCHGFAYRFLEKGYNLSGLGCGTPSAAVNEKIFDCVNKKGVVFGEFFINDLDAATEGDHTVILYRTSTGGIRHSAVKIESSNTYLSKFESWGGVRKHGRFEVPTTYYNTSIGDYITYHKLKSSKMNPGDPPASYWPAESTALIHSACTSCSCRTSQGWFIVNVSTNLGSGPGPKSYGPFTWNVSGASIALNANHYIYVNKPGGGYVGVTTSSTYTYRSSLCTKLYSKFSSFVFPSCSFFGGFSYSVPKMEVNLSGDRKSVSLVLPETMRTVMEKSTGSNTTTSFNIQVYDLNGRIYENKIITATRPYLRLAEPLQKGIYIFRLILGKDNAITEKISIE